ncbi:hypothetical protein A5893_14495 [Pedobacter psychrophilus]|uniref:Soluble ligand binding domain-containing protein n=1 Tax=Pedobacter psychrophilus TaxID=1826909 RepID=A0A179DCB3_9SPHI|nr:polysaccharide biosynthesis/export family protein [Pedobacter psychrophilus]OAQ38618.1 hypothetical protein A5893_14495 [Pedobacter psychrophilus]
MDKTNIFFLIIVTIILFTSCNNKTNTLFYVKSKGKINSSVSILLPGDIKNKQSFDQKILPGDLLSIRNLQNETQVLGYSSSSGASISTNYLVENDSTVTLPFLNRMKLGGMLVPEAENFLNQSYSKNLLKEPIIKITITNLKVTLMGEFGRVGNIPLEPNKTFLTDIIAEAGGLSKRANLKKIKIIRGNLKNPEVILVNLQDLNSLGNDKLYLHNNDIIYAETKNSYKFLDGISSGSTILGIGISAVSAYLLIDRLKN